MTDRQQPHHEQQTPSNVSESLAHYGVGVIVYAVVLGAVVALIAGLYEMSFRVLAGFWHDSHFLLDSVPQWVLYGVGPFLAIPVLYFIITQIPEKRQHNPADIITGIHIYNGKLDAKASILSAVASIFSIGLGYSVGYYGPTVQLGAGLGPVMHRLKWIRPAYLYISIGAGTAAAIAAIFHAPIGAVVFVHEVLLRFFSIRAFAPITIASVTSYIVSSKLFDKAIFFDVPLQYAPDPPTYLVAAIAGVLAAVIGVTMIQSILKLQHWSKKKVPSLLMQYVIAAAITALLITNLPQAAGSSLQAMQQVLDNQGFTLTLLMMIFLAKLIATVTAFGFNIPGGIFGPTIFIGAALGGLISQSIDVLSPNLIDSQHIIIISTMAAMISAVLGAPIAMILIVVEITGNFQIISVIMLAVVMANITAYRFMGTSSFFDIQLKSRGFDFEAGRDRLYTENHNIASIISKDYLAIVDSTLLSEAENQMLTAHKNLAFVIDDEGNLLGQAYLVEIEYYFRESDAETAKTATLTKVIHSDIPVLYKATSIWQAMKQISEVRGNFLPVVDGENNPKLLGVVDNGTLIKQYFSHLKTLRTQENVIRHNRVK